MSRRGPYPRRAAGIGLHPRTLEEPSVASCELAVTIPKDRLGERLGLLLSAPELA